MVCYKVIPIIETEEMKTEAQSSSLLSSIASVPTPASRQPLSSDSMARKAPGLTYSEKDKLLAQYDCVDYEGKVDIHSQFVCF